MPMLAPPTIGSNACWHSNTPVSRTHKVRRRERAELAALLHALHLYGGTLLVVWRSRRRNPVEDAWNTPDVLRSVVGAAGRLPLQIRGGKTRG